jgi:two-component sensor histidine kinase/tetratricopeptide (TPR) repeat protein
MCSGTFRRLIHGIRSLATAQCLLRHSLLILLCLPFLTGCEQKDPAKDTPPVTADTARLNFYLRKANAMVQVNLDSMKLFVDSAVGLADSARNAPGLARARAALANYQRRKGEYTRAIETSLDVIRQYDSLDMREHAVRMRNILADMYKELGDEKGIRSYLDKGLELSRTARQDATRYSFDEGVVISLNQEGVILRDISKRFKRPDLMDSALFLYQQALAIINRSGKGMDNLGKLYNNISQVYNEHRKDYAQALEFLNKAVLFNTARNNQNSLSYNYGNISDVYLQLGQEPLALEYARRMLTATQSFGAPHRIINALNQLARVHRKTGRYDSALHYRDWSVGIADSLNNAEKSAQIAEMQTRYETGIKDGIIEKLGELNRVREQRFWMLAAGALILTAMLFLVWRQMRRSQRQRKTIAEQADRLQWMMKELHHRVKNNLQIVSSLLNLQLYRMKDADSAAALRESQLRVQAMSLMHQRLYQVEDVSMVNFRLYLTDLAETLMRAYGYASDDFDLVIDIDQEMLDVDIVMPMGLLANEILTNAFKYAFSPDRRPALEIRLREQDKGLRLVIRDNGPGIKQEAARAEGFGQKLIAALSKQLKASYSVSSENGTCYTFDIPFTQKAA